MGWRNMLKIGSEWPADEDRLNFSLAGTELPMPTLVLIEETSTGKLDRVLFEADAGSVTLTYGRFSIFWFGATEGERALKEIVDMYDGCYQKQSDGSWLLLGAS